MNWKTLVATIAHKKSGHVFGSRKGQKQRRSVFLLPMESEHQSLPTDTGSNSRWISPKDRDSTMCLTISLFKKRERRKREEVVTVFEFYSDLCRGDGLLQVEPSLSQAHTRHG